jgi:FkbM family methyltransferase
MPISLSRVTSKPHYVFHPLRAARRALYGASGAANDTALHVARLPWGLPLKVYRSDAIGFTILTGGVFDPCVTETLYRLIDPGDLVVDVGANVGYLTSLAAVRSGAGGTVIAYEPHPVVYELLAANVASWAGKPGVARIDARQLAISDHSGTGELASGPLFNRNLGLAKLNSHGDPTDSANTVTVMVTRLDEAIGREPVGLLKIDVEGFEAEVLRGAGELLASGIVRDIVFEDHEQYPSAVTELVERAGYRLISLENNLLGLVLKAPADRGATSPWPGPSYLATREPERALQRLRARGWRIAGIGPTLPWRSGA